MNQTRTHWKALSNPNYLGEWALPNGQDIIATIDYVRREPVVGTNGKKEEKRVAHFKEGIKPLILNVTNSKVLASLYGTPYVEEWAGRKVQIYFDPTVKMGRDVCGGLRLRAFIPAIATVPTTCADCGKPISESNGQTPQQIAQGTYGKYAKPLCWECAMTEKKKIEARKAPNVFGGCGNAQ